MFPRRQNKLNLPWYSNSKSFHVLVHVFFFNMVINRLTRSAVTAHIRAVSQTSASHLKWTHYHLWGLDGKMSSVVWSVNAGSERFCSLPVTIIRWSAEAIHVFLWPLKWWQCWIYHMDHTIGGNVRMQSIQEKKRWKRKEVQATKAMCFLISPSKSWVLSCFFKVIYRKECNL